MSRRRYISTTISVDRVVAKLARDAGDFAALLYTWMIPHAEDSATLAGDPEELFLAVCPGFRHHTEEDVEQALEAMDKERLIAWDREAQVVYFDSESFYRHQSYIPKGKHLDHSERFRKRRTSPKNAAARGTAASKSTDVAVVDEAEADGAPGPAGYDSDPDFVSFWGFYPRTEGKEPSFRAWKRLNKAERRLALGVAEIMGALVSDGAKEKKYVPYAQKFLNQKMWEDWRDGVPVGWQDARSVQAAVQDATLDAALAEAFPFEDGDQDV